MKISARIKDSRLNVRVRLSFSEQLSASEIELLQKRVVIGLLKPKQLAAYGAHCGTELGTTFTGILFVGEEYVCAHVGDSRLYYIGGDIKQLTTDQTFIAREISSGRMTEEEAKTDKRRNVLLQCVGASKEIEPQVLRGRTEKGVHMLCSDGFRHVITEEEMLESLRHRARV